MLPQTGERQVAETLDGIKPNHRNRYQFAINKILERFGNHRATVLDCACGVGYGTAMLALYAEHAKGLDIFADAVDAANRAYKADNNSFAVCDLSDEASWNKVVNGQCFDAIVSIETIEHVQHADALIARYALATDFLVASVPNQDVVPYDSMRHPFHFRHYTRKQFEGLLARHGFVVESWATQYDKIPGLVYEDADDGMGFIVSARKA